MRLVRLAILLVCFLPPLLAGCSASDYEPSRSSNQHTIICSSWGAITACQDAGG